MDHHTGCGGSKKVAAAAERNKEVILQVLLQHLGDLQEPPRILLEIASGTGQHASAFGRALNCIIQPSDMVTDDFDSIRAWSSDLDNVLDPIVIDCTQESWDLPESSYDAVICSNMTHISPIEATRGLCRGAGHVLPPGGLLFIYGPFLVNGKPTTDSNSAFDVSLRSRNPEWGLRDMDSEIDKWCVEHGLERRHVHEMPANNFMLVYSKIV